MRLRFRNVGLLVALLGGGMAVVSLVVWCTEPPRGPDRMPWVIATFLLLTLLGVYLLLLYSRYRLFFSDSTIRQIGVFCDRQVGLDAIDELRWRRYPQGGSVRITGRSDLLKIELGNFKQVDRLAIIEFLRESIVEPKQIGWQEFDERFSETPEKQKQSIRIHFLLVVAFGAHAVAFGILWVIGAGGQYLVFSGINAMMVGYLLRSYHRKQAERGNLVGEQSDAPTSPFGGE